MTLRGNDLKQAYARGENIAELLRLGQGDGVNSETIIETAYDLQAGSYVAVEANEDRRDYKRRRAAEIVSIMRRLGQPAGLPGSIRRGRRPPSGSRPASRPARC